MNATNLYTRSRLGLDKRVWLVLLVTSLLSVGLLAFKMSTHDPCNAITLAVKDNEDLQGTNYYPQDRLTFTASMSGMREVSWDFGDNSPAVSGNNVVHAFSHAGNYFITATVNGKCKELLSVYIHPRIAAPVAAGPGSLEEIMGPDAPKAGAPVVYTTALNGTTFEWNVLNSPEYPTQNTPTVTYNFLTEGPKILELRVGDRVVRKSIQVLPPDKPLMDPNAAQLSQQPLPQQQQLPQDDAPVAEKAAAAAKSTFVADEVLKDLLDKVTEGEKDASSFTQFLCSGAQTKVRENGEGPFTTLGEFCTKIHDKKKYKIKSVVTIRDPNDKCVIQIQVSYKKKGFLGL